jgi:hypothetical protein
LGRGGVEGHVPSLETATVKYELDWAGRYSTYRPPQKNCFVVLRMVLLERKAYSHFISRRAVFLELGIIFFRASRVIFQQAATPERQLLIGLLHCRLTLTYATLALTVIPRSSCQRCLPQNISQNSNNLVDIWHIYAIKHFLTAKISLDSTLILLVCDLE